jgi:hypothetical protein
MSHHRHDAKKQSDSQNTDETAEDQGGDKEEPVAASSMLSSSSALATTNRVTVPLKEALPHESMIRASAVALSAPPFRIPRGGVQPSDSASQLKSPTEPGPTTKPRNEMRAEHESDVRKVVVLPLPPAYLSTKQKGVADIAAAAGSSRIGGSTSSSNRHSSLY